MSAAVALLGKIGPFQNWLVQNGVNLSNVDLRWSAQEGYHLVSATTAGPGEALLKLPRALVLSSDRVCDDPLVGSVLAKISAAYLDNGSREEAETLLLVLYLMHLRRHPAQAFWRPYLDVLPPHLTTPLYVHALLDADGSASYDALLAGTPIADELATNLDTLRRFWSDVIDAQIAVSDAGAALFAQREDASWTAFMWAYAIVETRAFKFRVGDRTVVALAPLCDFCNHSPTDANVRYVGSLSTDFMLVPRDGATVVPGTPLQLEYNAFDNSQLFLYYGFCVPANPLDGIALALDEEELAGLAASDDSADLEVRKALFMHSLADTGLVAYEHRLTRAADPLAGILPTLRLFVATAADLAHVNMSNVEQALRAPLSHENEALALEALVRMLRVHLEYCCGPSSLPLSLTAPGAEPLAAYVASLGDPLQQAFAGWALNAALLYVESLRGLAREFIAAVEQRQSAGFHLAAGR